MDQLLGRTLKGRYRIDSYVGGGGMANVYRAWDQSQRRYVALKILREDLADDPVFLRRFRREAAVLGQLQHPNIVRYHGLEQEHGLAYMVVEFIDGRSLRKEMAQLRQPMTPSQAAAILEPVCDALQYAHDRDLMHCDVKPANILVEKGGRVVLADFGIARWAESATTTFAGAGTPAYMSPEQCRGTGITRLTDIYSLSVTLYEMLTLDRPFVGDTGPPDSALGERIRWEHLRESPPSPRSLNPRIPAALEEVILTGLSKEPGMRQQTPRGLYRQVVAAGIEPDRTMAWAVEETLLPARTLGPKVDTLPEPPAPPAVPAGVRPRQKRGLLFLVMGVTVALLLVLAIALVGPAPDPPAPTRAAAVPTHTPVPTATTWSIPTDAVPPTPEATTAIIPSETPAPTPLPPPSTVYIEYVLDTSNSMMQSLSGERTRLAVAVSALMGHWQALDTEPNIGLRVYGHQLPVTDPGSCTDTELLAAPAQGQREVLAGHLHELSARGMSPLIDTLVKATRDFSFLGGRTNALILIADGGDNCVDKNPCDTVRTHLEVGMQYTINVVGLAVDETAKQQLQCMAQVSGGLYRDAASEAELISALNEFVAQILAEGQ